MKFAKVQCVPGKQWPIILISNTWKSHNIVQSSCYQVFFPLESMIFDSNTKIEWQPTEPSSLSPERKTVSKAVNSPGPGLCPSCNLPFDRWEDTKTKTKTKT